MEVSYNDTGFCIRAQGFSVSFADTPSNRKVAVIFLRGMRDARGKHLFTLKQLAQIVGSGNRQAASEHLEGFRACGEDFGATLQRKRKVDGLVVDAVRGELVKDPLVAVRVLRERVCARLGREDVSDGNIQAALDQISCKELRRVVRRQLDRGAAHYKEGYLLEEMSTTLSSEAGQKAGLGGGEIEAPLVSDPTAIRKLLTPGVSLEELPSSLGWVCRCLTFYSWGVSLSRLGRWLGVHKTTVLRWMLGLVVCLWPVVVEWIGKKVHGGVIYVDEKWLKIRGIWHYWFVALDERTQLPLVTYLAARRSRWACRWVGLKLQQLGVWIKAVCTDGFPGYRTMLPQIPHLLSHFHHQQGVTSWLKEHFPKHEEVLERKQAMKGVVQTTDKRTVRRRLEKLSAQASCWGIVGWVEKTRGVLSKLLPSVGSRVLPRTTNAIERFFRTFSRFYKVRCGFHSVRSARLELMLFMLVYVFTQREKDGKAPIEAIMPQAAQMPLYRLLNDPFGRLEPSQDVKEVAPMAEESVETLLAA
jgi:transposase-like protein